MRKENRWCSYCQKVTEFWQADNGWSICSKCGWSRSIEALLKALKGK